MILVFAIIFSLLAVLFAALTAVAARSVRAEQGQAMPTPVGACLCSMLFLLCALVSALWWVLYFK